MGGVIGRRRLGRERAVQLDDPGDGGVLGIQADLILSVLLGEGDWTIDVIDTWNMTVERVPGIHSDGSVRVDLPGRPFMAVRLTRV